jgi:hypothetical protein
VDLHTTSAGLSVFGDNAGDESGYALAAGDINADGTDDLIIGAYGADSAGRTDAGEAYVIYGGPSLPSTIDLDSTGADLTVYGDDAYDWFGHAVAAGDVNGDHIDDLIIGAYVADPPGGANAGKAYVIHGGSSLPSTIDLDTTSADLTVYGNDVEDYLGLAVATGDVNGDGIGDLIIGASGADPAGGTDAGETYVIYGGSSLPSTVDLDSTSANLTIHGDDAGDESGYALAAGDINNDGIDDLIIGAWGADPTGGARAGETYVIYGSLSLPSAIDLSSTSASLTVYGDDEDDQSGVAVAAADVDGDGRNDLIIGAYLADPPGGANAGEAYAIYGSAYLPPVINLDTTSVDLTIYGDDTHDRSSYAVEAGDLNGDGIEDVIIGAHLADGSGTGTSCGTGQVGDRCETGETYVIYGEREPVGGIAKLPDVSDSSGRNYIALAALAAAALVALAASIWYVRRHRSA